jgi:ribonuclease III
VLGHRFAKRELLELALTHSSRAYEDRDGTRGNEQLEFLGDAVLSLVISERLMELKPADPEGALSQARAATVNQGALATLARRLGLGEFVRLGRGEDRSGGREKDSILANVFEALLGALYSDAGLAPVRELVRREFTGELSSPPSQVHDAKTRLQELLHRLGEPAPTYVLTDTRGPDHAREFSIEVRSGERLLASGEGRSKREAEQAAALDALAVLQP